MSKSIEHIAYELYKQEWIDSHTTPERRLNVLREFYKDDDYTDFDEYINDVGYNGELYASFDEFMDNEYEDASIMEELLKDKDLIQAYHEDID
ncbi:hypothetical protein J6A31_09000 [bacterium]|nr:hypothetical protein [bacterium]